MFQHLMYHWNMILDWKLMSHHFLDLQNPFYLVSNIAFSLFCDMTLDCRDLSLYLTGPPRRTWHQNQNFSYDRPAIFFANIILRRNWNISSSFFVVRSRERLHWRLPWFNKIDIKYSTVCVWTVVYSNNTQTLYTSTNYTREKG